MIILGNNYKIISHRTWKFSADISDIYKPTKYRSEV